MTKEVTPVEVELTPVEETHTPTPGGPGVSDWSGPDKELSPNDSVEKIEWFEKSKILQESMDEARTIINNKFNAKERKDIFKSEVVAPDSVLEIYKDRGKKYIENTIKVCITLPYLIKTNQDMLKEHLSKFDMEIDEVKKTRISEDVFATITQIKQLNAQIDAHENISLQYVTVLERLKELS